MKHQNRQFTKFISLLKCPGLQYLLSGSLGSLRNRVLDVFVSALGETKMNCATRKSASPQSTVKGTRTHGSAVPLLCGVLRPSQLTM